VETGSQSNVKQIRSVLIKNPKNAFINQEHINAQWKSLNYLACPDYEEAIREYESFVQLLSLVDPEILHLPLDATTGPDSLYTHDPALIFETGAVLLNMGKQLRKGEPDATEAFLREIQFPIAGRITGNGTVEGGDVCWLDERTLAVGEGYRTNAEGIEQLKDITKESVDEVISVHLPHWTGPDDCLHLLSFMSPIDSDLFLVYSRLMSASFRNTLLDRGIQLVEVPDVEYDSMACNVLPIAPRKCIMLEGNPVTRKRLEENGTEVWTYKGEEMSLKGGGGPTCLTRPLIRE